MGKTFITADTHFGHEGILGFCNRPFKNVEKMNEVLIRNWNGRVKPKDTVIFLGDFAYRTAKHIGHYLDQLNGEKIFIRGNHDKNNGLRTKIENLVLRNGNDIMFCVHDPRHINKDITINLVGHIHNNWKARKVRWNDGGWNIIVNVGVDVWNFYPAELQELMAYIQHIKKNFPALNYDYNEWKKPFEKKIIETCKGQCGYDVLCRECEKKMWEERDRERNGQKI
jgi:calcineurin-like phosphoesterase family protein